MVKEYERTNQFLEAALEDGAHFRIPKMRNKGKEAKEITWTREKNAIAVYYGSPATHQDISRYVLGLTTRQGSWYILSEGMWNLWENCSDPVKDQFPWGSFPLKKPLPLRSRMQISLTHGGVTARIAEIFEQDHTKSYSEIRKAGFSNHEIEHAKRTLSGWGFNIDYKRNELSKYQKLQKEMEEELKRKIEEQDMQLLQSLIDRSNYTFRQHRRTMFASVTRVAESISFKFDLNTGSADLVEFLKQSGVPATSILDKGFLKSTGKERHYHVIYANHIGLAKKALSNYSS